MIFKRTFNFCKLKSFEQLLIEQREKLTQLQSIFENKTQIDLTQEQRNNVQFLHQQIQTLSSKENIYLQHKLENSKAKEYKYKYFYTNIDWNSVINKDYIKTEEDFINELQAQKELWPDGMVKFSSLLTQLQANQNIKGGSVQKSESAEVKATVAVEKSSFNIQILSYEAVNKIKFIKEVRTIMGLGLKEAKDTVESIPFIMKENVLPDEAEKLQEKLKELKVESVLI